MRLEVIFFFFNRKLNGGIEKLICLRLNVKEVKEKRYKFSFDSELVRVDIFFFVLENCLREVN